MEDEPKKILDRWATKIITKEAIWTKRTGEPQVNAKKQRMYANGGYDKEIVLWTAPKNCVRIEFENTTEKNNEYIEETMASCIAAGIDYCVTDHKGKSPYLNIFNIQGIPVGSDNKLAKQLLVDSLLTEEAKKYLDKTNLAHTWTPVIGHEHWKPKYKGEIHAIKTGKHPLEHNNKYPLDLKKQLERSKKEVQTSNEETIKDDQWVEDFLINYCCTNKLPTGNRHNIICKNLAIYIYTRKDRETIEQKFSNTQNMGLHEIKGWYPSISNGKFNKVNPGELYNYIKENNLNYYVKREEKQLLKRIDLNNIYDNVETYYSKQPFFYDKNKIFWMWNDEKHYYEIIDETDLINHLEKELSIKGLTYTQKTSKEYLECFKRVGRLNMPKDAPTNWVQYKDKAFDITKSVLYDIKPNYFFTNPIPWSIGGIPSTPVMDQLFREWVGEENVQTLYEFIAYCTYREYPIHVLVCLWGNGRNGKSQFLKILDKFIGQNNTSSTELDMISSNRFESFNLYKKLICFIGETNFGMLNNTSTIKRLTGGDLIRFEKKNKDPFNDYNYAKMIIASNSLPTTEDTSDGFYRRWLIIEFPNEFEDTGREVWMDVPQEEYNNLAKKCTMILPNLLERGTFTGQGSIEERKQKYISVSNPLSLFLNLKCERKPDLYISYGELYNEYVVYLSKHKRRIVNRPEFKAAMELEGLFIRRTSKDGESDLYFLGIGLKTSVGEVVENSI